MNLAKIKKGIFRPADAVGYCRQLLRGYYCKCKYKLLRKNVTIGKNFKVSGRLIIRGPGKVTIGNDVNIDGTGCPVTPWTYQKDAEIIIGNNVFLNGTRFGCQRKIEIGDDGILADCRILDTDFHSTDPTKRNDPLAVKSAPIKIGKNVWVSLDCVILRGVTIGDNSTITAKSVVIGNVPENCIYGGNPAIFIKKACTT
jgi:acetyltransferase-like isoleucine patch superfamily enzyme